MSDHIIKSFDDELKALKSTVVEMGVLADAELQSALDALVERDGEKAQIASGTDWAVNKRDRLVDETVIRLIATRQPVADDLRTIIACLHASTDLERVGDQAKNIANRVSTLAQLPASGIEQDIADLGALVRQELRDAVAAFDALDAEKAAAVRARDQQVDRRYTDLFREIIALNAEDAKRSAVCAHLSLVVRSLERIGDNATNVAEEVIFIVTGYMPEDDRVKADESFYVTSDAVE